MANRLRNPGCEYCIYSKTWENLQKKRTDLFCLEHAKIHISSPHKKWRWVDCENGAIKNKNKLCMHFKRMGFFFLLKKIREKKLKHKFLPEKPVLKGDKYWIT